MLDHVFLANGASPIKEDGSVGFDEAKTIEVLEFYKKLAEASPPGELFWYLVTSAVDCSEGPAGPATSGPRVLDVASVDGDGDGTCAPHDCADDQHGQNKRQIPAEPPAAFALWFLRAHFFMPRRLMSRLALLRTVRRPVVIA